MFSKNVYTQVPLLDRSTRDKKNGALGDTRQNRSPVRFYSIYNNSLLSEAKKRIYPFQSLATNSIVKQFAFKEFMRGCGERGGSVVECRTPEREVGESKPTAAVLCP